MKANPNWLDRFPPHPIIFSFYAVLFLWVNNMDQAPFYAIFNSMATAIGLGTVIYTVCSLILRKINKAAIYSSYLIILFLTYGHVYYYIKIATSLGGSIVRHRFLGVIWLVLVVTGVILIHRSGVNLRTGNRVLNLVSGCLSLFLVVQAAYYQLQIKSSQSFQSEDNTQIKSNSIANTPGMDVYYIILDSYGREDVLYNHFGLDNKPFLEELSDIGFVIPGCSQSNYTTTMFSMVSSLNLNYIPELGVPIHQDAEKIIEHELYPHLHRSLVRQIFEEIGYQTITFKTLYPSLNISDSDYYFDLGTTKAFYNKLESQNFQSLFFKTTILRIVTDFWESTPADVKRHRGQFEENLYALERLQEIPDIPGKKFVYAHLFTTHQPFVFTADGDIRFPIAENNEGYRNQVIYTNKRILEIIKKILEKSSSPPVIILQSDHNYLSTRERGRILNAYYLPGDGSRFVTDSTTPVNTFRLIFNSYFGGDYELLQDKSYYSPKDHPYQFELLPHSCAE